MLTCAQVNKCLTYLIIKTPFRKRPRETLFGIKMRQSPQNGWDRNSRQIAVKALAFLTLKICLMRFLPFNLRLINFAEITTVCQYGYPSQSIAIINFSRLMKTT
jgi:hypothetical protein